MVSDTWEFIVFPELLDRLFEHWSDAWDLLLLIAYIVRETQEQKSETIKINLWKIRNKFKISKERCSRLLKKLWEYWFITPYVFRDNWKISAMWFNVTLDYNLFF